MTRESARPWPRSTGGTPAGEGCDGAPDALLVAMVRRGDPEGGTELFARYASPLLRFTSRMLGDSSEAEEVTQEVFLKVISRAGQYDGRAPVSSWLFAIAANACRDRLRSPARRVFPIDDDSPLFASPAPAESALLAREREEAVRRALVLLSPEQREALVLARWHEMPYAEVARTLGITEGAVKTRVFRAMETLKAHFSRGDFPCPAPNS